MHGVAGMTGVCLHAIGGSAEGGDKMDCGAGQEGNSKKTIRKRLHAMRKHDLSLETAKKTIYAN